MLIHVCLDCRWKKTIGKGGKEDSRKTSLFYVRVCSKHRASRPFQELEEETSMRGLRIFTVVSLWVSSSSRC